MQIACVGWGSLVWEPRDLPVEPDWHADGPPLPVELCGLSPGSNLVAFLLRPAAPPVPTLWAAMTTRSLLFARDALADREGFTGAERESGVGHWSAGGAADGFGAEAVGVWAAGRGFDAAVWTARPPSFHAASPDGLAAEVVAHVAWLKGREKDLAEEYVRRTPRQIDTAVRRAVQAAFGWTPTDG